MHASAGCKRQPAHFGPGTAYKPSLGKEKPRQRTSGCAAGLGIAARLAWPDTRGPTQELQRTQSPAREAGQVPAAGVTPSEPWALPRVSSAAAGPANAMRLVGPGRLWVSPGTKRRPPGLCRSRSACCRAVTQALWASPRGAEGPTQAGAKPSGPSPEGA